MQVCPECGEENPPRFRLCGFCGTPLAAALPDHEVRKLVTIIFCDLKGSTDLGEQLDPESLREVMLRYFDSMRAAIEEHGGRVEKYIGDAVMAVFGLPRLHEDDALRAVRAAKAMQEALAGLNDELERQWGVRLTNRIGVNTGEVVAADPVQSQRLVTGDAVNVAARLEQAAGHMEALLGDLTYRLVRAHVEVEPVEPLTLKGKSEPVPAYRLVALRAAPAKPDVERPIVGRADELALLRAELRRATEARAARLVTILADAGVGKTRLLEELAAEVEREAWVLRGRCLPYGRGITFWPLLEIARAAADIDADDAPDVALEKLTLVAGGDEAVTRRVAAAIGFSHEQFPLDELFWGARKLVGTLAARRPLVLVVEDIHWAEATFLDLLEQLAASVEAPVLLVCAARPTLLDIRPGWAERDGAPTIELAPLSDEDSARVIENLLGGEFPDAIRARVVTASEGNPLFVEQLLSMLVDEGVLHRDGDRWVADAPPDQLEVPATIQALLAARLDLLTREERAVVEPAAVMGLVFSVGALEDLVAEAVLPQVRVHLEALERKQLIRRDAAAGDGAFRFAHILIRDAAYNGQLKRARATLHVRFVDWGERANRDRETEYEEIHGYHLEQAHNYLAELGPLDDHGREVGARGAARLASAGRRAFGRGDMPAAANLLRRAVSLPPRAERDRLELLPDLGEALMETGEFAWAEVFLDEAVEGASRTGDIRLEADAVLTRLLVRHHAATNLDAWREEVERETDRLIPALERQEANAELAKAWRMVAFVHGAVCRWEAVAAAQQRAIEHARQAGRPRQEARAASGYTIALRDGPTPVADAIARCEEIVDSRLVDRQAEALVLCSLAYLEGMRGEFERARELYSRARALFVEVGAAVLAAHTSLTSGRVELLAGDAAAAERELRGDYEALGAMGERYFRPLVAALLAQAVYLQGRYEEARELTEEARQLADTDDIETQAVWRTILARLHFDEGEGEQAEALAREAVDLLRLTDAPVMRGDALLQLGVVLNGRGQHEEARAVLEEASRLYSEKGVRAGRIHGQLGELEAELTESVP